MLFSLGDCWIHSDNLAVAGRGGGPEHQLMEGSGPQPTESSERGPAVPRRFIGAHCCLDTPCLLLHLLGVSAKGSGGRNIMYQHRRRRLASIQGAGSGCRGAQRLIDADIRSEAWQRCYWRGAVARGLHSFPPMLPGWPQLCKQSFYERPCMPGRDSEDTY